MYTTEPKYCVVYMEHNDSVQVHSACGEGLSLTDALEIYNDRIHRGYSYCFIAKLCEVKSVLTYTVV